MARLNPSFFKLTGTRTSFSENLDDERTGYPLRDQTYKSVLDRSTMVLFSRQTDTPLAALCLRSSNNKSSRRACMTMLADRPPPATGANKDDHYIQGMLNLPDEPFEFVVTNLTSWGEIIFSITHHRSSRWRRLGLGRGGRVNYATLLNPNLSSTINADYKNGNRRMVLGLDQVASGGDDNTNDDGKVTSKSFTVRDTEEQKRRKKKKGLYFDCEVSPDQTCRELVRLFAEGPAAWRVTSEFVRQVPSDEILQNRPKPLEVKLPAFILGNSKRSKRQRCSSDKSTTTPKTQMLEIDGPPMNTRVDEKHDKKQYFGADGGGETACCDVGSTLAATLKHIERVENDAVWVPKFLFQRKRRHRCETTVLCMSVWPDMDPPPAKATFIKENWHSMPTLSITDFQTLHACKVD